MDETCSIVKNINVICLAGRGGSEEHLVDSGEDERVILILILVDSGVCNYTFSAIQVIYITE
jgi:hypothetical protein